MDFDDLDAMLENIVKKIPEKKEELLENVGDIIQEQVRSNIESRVGTSGTGEKEKLIEGVQKVIGSGKGYVAIKPDYSSNSGVNGGNSHLHHLIENGHRIVRNGVVVGFSNGKHMYRDSAEQCEGQIIKMAEDMIDEVVKDD